MKRWQVLLIVGLCAVGAAMAADDTLLVQLVPDGKFKVWHAAGETSLSGEELNALTANDGAVVVINGRELLIDRDDCGGVKIWHGAGATTLSEDELTELMLTALPGGGRRIDVGERVAKGYLARHGVVVLLWKPAKR